MTLFQTVGLVGLGLILYVAGCLSGYLWAISRPMKAEDEQRLRRQFQAQQSWEESMRLRRPR